MNRDKCKRALFLCVKYLVSAAVVAVVVGPLLVTLFTSVKTQAQLASTSPILPPAPGAWNWDNYAEVLGAKLLPVAVKNRRDFGGEYFLQRAAGVRYSLLPAAL